jgi:hypothetical protein
MVVTDGMTTVGSSSLPCQALSGLAFAVSPTGG